MTRVFLGLGSNLGDREAMLNLAVDALCSGLAPPLLHSETSGLYQSEALLAPEAPAEWKMPFLNMAVGGDTLLSPLALLEAVKQIERNLGRQFRGHWGPREIDIDILAYGSEQVKTAELQIPHKELLRRDFVLYPLAEIAPGWRYPVAGECEGMTARELAARCGASSLQRYPLEVN